MTSKDSVLKIAKDLIAKGYQVVPKAINKKHPAINGWDKLLTKEYQLQLFEDLLGNTADGICIVTGKISNLTVIDFDDLTIAKNVIELFSLTEYPIVKTRKGVHLYLPYDSRLKTNADAIFHIDVRNDGGCVVAPPSPYVYENENNNGGNYCFISFNELKKLTI